MRSLDGEIEPVMAWGWKPLLASIMRHAPEDGPSGDILTYARQMEKLGSVLAATLLPSFPHADTKYTGVSAIVVGDARNGGRESRAPSATGCSRSRGIGAPNTRSTRRRSPNRSRAPRHSASANPGAPVLLIDHCDNCGSGGAQDVMDVVAEILNQQLDDVAIAPIRDASAVAAMIDAGDGSASH